MKTIEKRIREAIAEGEGLSEALRDWLAGIVTTEEYIERHDAGVGGGTSTDQNNQAQSKRNASS